MHLESAARALEHIDRKDAPQELGPGQPPGALGRLAGCRQGRLRSRARRNRSVPVWRALRRARFANPEPVMASSFRRTRWLGRKLSGRIPRTNALICQGRARHYAIALSRARAQDPVVANEVETGRRDQRRESLDELLRLEDDVGRAIAPAVLQSVEQPPSSSCDRRSVATGGRAT